MGGRKKCKVPLLLLHPASTVLFQARGIGRCTFLRILDPKLPDVSAQNFRQGLASNLQQRKFDVRNCPIIVNLRK
jgi:hypothetical protein